MAHRRGLSSRHINMAKFSFDSPPLTPPLAMINSFHHSNSVATSTRKQYWQRTTFLALFALVIVSVYVLLISQPSLTPISIRDANRSFQNAASDRLSKLSSEAYRLAALHRHRPTGTAAPHVAAQPVEFTPEQELAAVTDFLASLPQNVIPSSVDPSIPIDPQLVLDFDATSPQADEMIKELVHDAWTRYPVVLYSKMHSPVARELKQMLAEMNLLPSPAVIEVEDRPDEHVLKALLQRLTGDSELPVLLVGGSRVGTMQEIRYMYTKGDLARKITNAGAIIDGAKKKKGRKH